MRINYKPYYKRTRTCFMNNFQKGNADVLLNNISVGNLQHLLKADLGITDKGCKAILFAPPLATVVKDKKGLNGWW